MMPLRCGVAIVLLVLVAGCASSGRGPLVFAGGAIDAIRADGYPRTRAEIAAYPYAQLGVRLEGARPGIAVLAEYVDSNHLWLAADGFQLLMTPSGRVLSVLIADTLVRFSPVENDPLDALEVDQRASPYVRQMQFGPARSPEDHTRHAVTCELVATARETLVVHGVTHATTRLEERCVAPGGLQLSSTIWVDDARRMVRVLGHMPGAAGRTYQFDALKHPQ